MLRILINDLPFFCLVLGRFLTYLLTHLVIKLISNVININGILRIDLKFIKMSLWVAWIVYNFLLFDLSHYGVVYTLLVQVFLTFAFKF